MNLFALFSLRRNSRRRELTHACQLVVWPHCMTAANAVGYKNNTGTSTIHEMRCFPGLARILAIVTPVTSLHLHTY